MGELGEELPTYQMSFTLYENGVTNDLVMDYGDYALSGSLEEIEPLADQGCPIPRRPAARFGGEGQPQGESFPTEALAYRVHGALRARPLFGACIDKVSRLDKARIAKVADPNADQPVFLTVKRLAQQSRPLRKMRSARLVYPSRLTFRVMRRKSSRLQLQHDESPGEPLPLKPCRYLLRQFPQMRERSDSASTSRSKVVSAEMLFALRSGLTARKSSPRARRASLKPIEP